MGILILIIEIVGTVSFAISGALIGIRKEMDLFGVCVMGLTTACGGGLFRDIMLDRLPPAMFTEPVYALTALCVSLIVFFIIKWKKHLIHNSFFDKFMLIADSAGLGLFSVVGVQIAINAGYGENFFFAVFLAIVTAVGGGLLRDIMAENPPYIFVKHIYASAALSGIVLCYLLRGLIGEGFAMLVGGVSVFIIRMLAAHYRWSLPRIRNIGGDDGIRHVPEKAPGNEPDISDKHDPAERNGK